MGVYIKGMGVYIKGMEMPTRCCECRLSTCHSFKERPLCDVLVKYMSYGEWEAKRLDDCPLVPVPPHGKLIDADAILQEATKGEEPFDWIDKNELLRLFFDAPTIISAEEGEK